MIFQKTNLVVFTMLTVCAQCFAQITSKMVYDPINLNGNNGFVVNAQEAKTYLGQEVAFVGDLNGDGLDDIALGDYSKTIDTMTYAGITYVIFGSKKPFTSSFDLSSLDGTNGFVVKGTAAQQRIGNSVQGLGDINGDGLDDMIIVTENSKELVIYGSRKPFPKSLTINDINGTNGFLVNLSGSANEAAGVGDINGDGISDFIIGVSFWGGQTWVIFGRNSDFPATIDGTWLDGNKGFRVAKYEANIPAFLMGSAGDINGDGLKDFIIGSWNRVACSGGSIHCPTGHYSYVIFGKNTAFKPLIYPDSLKGTDGFAISNEGGDFLSFVGNVGDINGDGIDDLFSEKSIIFGSKSPFPSIFQRKTLNGANGFTIPTTLGASPLGDLNSDGINDFLISYGDYVVYGKKNGYPDSLLVSNLDGTNGFQIKASGMNTSRNTDGNGDFNGDGKPDFIVGDPAGNRVFVFLGNPMDQYLKSEDLAHVESSSCFPNPFNHETRLSIPESAKAAKLEVYNTLGVSVDVLDFEKEIVFGKDLAPGIYYVKLNSAGQSEMIKVVKE